MNECVSPYEPLRMLAKIHWFFIVVSISPQFCCASICQILLSTFCGCHRACIWLSIMLVPCS